MATTAELPLQVQKRNFGLDLLKALLALLIILRHTGFISIAAVEGSGIHVFSASKLLYFSIQNLCVPIFMIISLNFFIQKRQTKERYFQKRIVRLCQILLFWWPVYFLLTKFTDFPLVPNSPLGILLIPLLNGALYFLGGLVCCVIAIELLERFVSLLPEKYRESFLLAAVVLSYLGSEVLRFSLSGSPSLLASFVGLGPLTFFAYPAAVTYLHHKKTTAGWLILFAIALSFQGFEFWRAASVVGWSSKYILQIVLLTYGSPLIIPLSMAVIAVFSSLSIDHLPRALAWLAKNCLGIYLVHPIIIAVGNRITHNQFLFIKTRCLIWRAGKAPSTSIFLGRSLFW